MNLDLIDNMDGFILRERESSLGTPDNPQTAESSAGMTRFPSKTPLAMAYVPYQQWGDVYDDDKALCQGTLFPELDLPFRGGASRE